MNTYSDFEEFQPELSENETVLMRLKPNRQAYIQLRLISALSKIFENLPILFVPVLGIVLISRQFNQTLGEMVNAYIAMMKQTPGFFIIFGIFIGVWILVLLFPAIKDVVTAYRSYSNTAYFITDKRIIFFQGNTYPIETSIQYSNIDRIHVVNSPRHTSSIYIVEAENYDPFLSTRRSRRKKVIYDRSVLQCLENVEMVNSRIYTEVRKYKNID